MCTANFHPTGAVLRARCRAPPSTHNPWHPPPLARSLARSCTPCRFTHYPQELLLRLDQPARVAQLQLLSHEYKIASKLELLAGTFDGPGGAAAAAGGGDPAKASWRKLGLLTFEDNERSQFTARELKTVSLRNTPMHLLLLRFKECHMNQANVYGQARRLPLELRGCLPLCSRTAVCAGSVLPFCHVQLLTISQLAVGGMACMHLQTSQACMTASMLSVPGTGQPHSHQHHW